MDDIEKATFMIMVVVELLKAERKIAAIKLVRYIYNANLVDAKHLVDTIQNLMK